MIYTTLAVALMSLDQELNIDAEEVETLMVSCILDNTIHGRIDQVQQILEVDHEPQGSSRYKDTHYIAAVRLALLLSALKVNLSLGVF